MIGEEMLREARQGKMKAGKTQLIKHLKGERLYRSEAIKAKCYDCNGMGEQTECDLTHCALWPYSPYRVDPS